jgi:hypothetical protein
MLVLHVVSVKVPDLFTQVGELLAREKMSKPGVLKSMNEVLEVDLLLKPIISVFVQRICGCTGHGRFQLAQYYG